MMKRLIATLALTLAIFGLNFATASGDEWTIHGTQFNDGLHGHPHVDNLYGHGGNDFLSGKEGPDRLSGGEGYDTCNGGAGADAFIGCDNITG